MAALLGLFWRLLREGRLKVARGRSWQPEIGMEHASRGRRSGNKGVGARWRGRFRIFSARHCSRTKVSHAENSGMTMLFFSLEVAPVSEGDSFTRPGAASHACRRGSGSTRELGFYCMPRNAAVASVSKFSNLLSLWSSLREEEKIPLTTPPNTKMKLRNVPETTTTFNHISTLSS